MNLAQSDRELLSFKPEATFGTVASTGNHYALRMNGADLAYNLVTAESQEIRNGRGVGDLIVVDADAGGNVPAEFSYGEYDSLIAAALATAPSNVVGTNGATTGTATFSATGMTYSSGAPFSACESGQWIGISGATQTGNNKLVQITGILGTGTGISVASGTFTAETGSTGVVAMGARFKNGSTQLSFSIERRNQDITYAYECFRGQVVNNWSQSYQRGSIITQGFEFMGKDALPMATGSALPGSRTASLTNKIMNAVSNISNVYEGGTLLTSTYVQSLSLRTSNNVEMLKAVGNLGPIGFRLGAFNVGLSAEFFLADAALYNKFINNTDTSFSYRLTDASGYAYVVTVPNGNYSTGRRPNPGRNNSIILTMEMRGLEDSNGVSLIIDRCGAAVTPWS
jgi:hypothetical protein